MHPKTCLSLGSTPKEELEVVLLAGLNDTLDESDVSKITLLNDVELWDTSVIFRTVCRYEFTSVYVPVSVVIILILILYHLALVVHISSGLQQSLNCPRVSIISSCFQRNITVLYGYVCECVCVLYYSTSYVSRYAVYTYSLGLELHVHTLKLVWLVRLL